MINYCQQKGHDSYAASQLCTIEDCNSNLWICAQCIVEGTHKHDKQNNDHLMNSEQFLQYFNDNTQPIEQNVLQQTGLLAKCKKCLVEIMNEDKKLFSQLEQKYKDYQDQLKLNKKFKTKIIEEFQKIDRQQLDQIRNIFKMVQVPDQYFPFIIQLEEMILKSQNLLQIIKLHIDIQPTISQQIQQNEQQSEQFAQIQNVQLPIKESSDLQLQLAQSNQQPNQQQQLDKNANQQKIIIVKKQLKEKRKEKKKEKKKEKQKKRQLKKQQLQLEKQEQEQQQRLMQQEQQQQNKKLNLIQKSQFEVGNQSFKQNQSQNQNLFQDWQYFENNNIQQQLKNKISNIEQSVKEQSVKEQSNQENQQKIYQNHNEDLQFGIFFQAKSERQITTVDISKNLQYLAYGGYDNILKVMDMYTKNILKDIEFNSRVQICKFSHDSNLLLCYEYTNILHIFETQSFKLIHREKVSKQQLIDILMIDENSILLYSEDLIQIKSQDLQELLQLQCKSVRSLDYSQEQLLICCCTQGNYLYVFDSQNGFEIANQQISENKQLLPFQVQFIQSTSYILSADKNQIIQWSLSIIDKRLIRIGQFQINNNQSIINFSSIYDDKIVIVSDKNILLLNSSLKLEQEMPYQNNGLQRQFSFKQLNTLKYLVILSQYELQILYNFNEK